MGGNSKKSLFIYLAIIVVLMIVATQVYSVSNTPETTPYNEILSYFQNDQVKEYTLDYGTGELTIKLRDNNKEIYYMVPNLTVFYNDTHEMVKEYNKTITTKLT